MRVAPPPHPAGINPKVVAKVLARRGRLHAFETLDPQRTALVVIDLNTASVLGDENCRRIVPGINRLAGALRDANGHVAWVLTDFSWGDNAEAVFGRETVARFRRENSGEPGEPGELWERLDRRPGDISAVKSAASAFFPGKCDLDRQLRARGIDTLLIAGTVTNVCCESSARDACELGYRVTMVADACAGHAHGLHEAALATFYRCFGDVRTVSDVVGLIEK